jgi:LmbE family N-acetylglucosaminyl deacetylase
MLPLRLEPPPGRPLSVLAVGAHPDDVEIGAGGPAAAPGAAAAWITHLA